MSMADGGFPNKNRASNAYDAYGDAMRPYVARVLEDAHGPDWIRRRLLSDDLRENNRRRYDEIRQALQALKPLEEIVDRADIPNLVNGDRENFPDLNRDEVRNLFTIRGLRNAIVHSGQGDCTVEEANAIIGLCVLTLERCGLSDAAENVRGLSLEAVAGATAVSEADLREQRERREWDKARLEGKSPEELTPWEQQRLAEIEWEEEWERRELMRREREEIARFGDDIDGLRLWFDADEARHDRHPSEQTALLQREEERHEQREHERRERERAQAERKRLEQQAHERRERERRERELRERERVEIAAFGDNLDGLRRWFNAYKVRPKRHSFEYAELFRREDERAKQKRGRTEIAAFGDDDEGLRRWFDADKARHDRHPIEYAALCQRERERREQQAHERRERERLERARHERERMRERRERIERERTEIAAFGDDLGGLRLWFVADEARRDHHPSEYAALRERERREWELREREQAEIAAFGDDISGLRRWFHKDNVRRKHHPSEYAALHQQERHERRERELQERERAEIAAFGDDIYGLRRWFHKDNVRRKRHPSEYEALHQRERRERRERKRREQETREAAEQGERSSRSRIFRRR